MGWVGTVLAAAERQGVARGALLAQAGIAPEELTAERWPIDHITRLWRAAVHCTQDAGFGLKAGAGVGPASFNVVSYLLQSAPTLRAALALVQKYQRLISDGGRFQTITGPEACWVVYHPRQGALAFSPHQIESVLAAVVVFARWVTGSALRPQRVQLSQARIGPLAGYREVFQCPVDFEQAFSGVLLANAQLDAPLPQANAQLAQAHQQQAAARLAALCRQDGLEQTLRMWIASQLQGQAPARGAGGARPGPVRAHPGAAHAGRRPELLRAAGRRAARRRPAGGGADHARAVRHCAGPGLCRTQRVHPRLQALDRCHARPVARPGGGGHARPATGRLTIAVQQPPAVSIHHLSKEPNPCAHFKA